MMWVWATFPFALQAIAILFDEFYFHHRRGLPKWERIGHPMDTLSLLVCFLLVMLAPFQLSTLIAYCGLAVISCIMITKDEFIHKEHCPGAENWLHAMLFILHPITLLMNALMWAATEEATLPSWILNWLDHPQELRQFMQMQTGAIGLFFLYQIIFWNFFAYDRTVIKHQQ